MSSSQIVDLESLRFMAEPDGINALPVVIIAHMRSEMTIIASASPDTSMLVIRQNLMTAVIPVIILKQRWIQSHLHFDGLDHIPISLTP